MKRGVCRRFVTTKRGLSRGSRSPRRTTSALITTRRACRRARSVRCTNCAPAPPAWPVRRAAPTPRSSPSRPRTRAVAAPPGSRRPPGWQASVETDEKARPRERLAQQRQQPRIRGAGGLDGRPGARRPRPRRRPRRHAAALPSTKRASTSGNPQRSLTAQVPSDTGSPSPLPHHDHALTDPTASCLAAAAKTGWAADEEEPHPIEFLLHAETRQSG